MFDLFAQAETTKGHYGYLMLSVATRGGDCCWRDRNKADERFLLSGSAFAFSIPTHPWLNQTTPINLPKQSLPNSWRWRSHGPLAIFGHNSWVNLLVHGRWQPWKVQRCRRSNRKNRNGRLLDFSQTETSKNHTYQEKWRNCNNAKITKRLHTHAHIYIYIYV